jgi:aspartyl aminopeptidase
LRIEKPLLRIPHLAIHLTAERSSKFEWNNETHLKSIISTTFYDEKDKKNEKQEDNSTSLDEKVGTKLANLISKTAKIEKNDIIDFDLVLYDVQPSCLLGLDDEFVSSGRLDNLITSFVSVHALINNSKTLENQSSINFIALFDNEEVGSMSFSGADSEFFGNNLERIFNTIEGDEEVNSDSFRSCCARSFVLSCDLSHSIHPNYPEKHQSEHKPVIHGGITIKINPNTRYATDSEGASIIKELCKKADVPFQDFIVRQDSPCGTTIGPIISGKLGIKTADVGIPQLAMHSIRELCGTVDLYHYRKFMEEFLLSYQDCVGDLTK